MSALAPHDAAKACANPLRATIIDKLDGRVASPVELARELNLDVPQVGYHVRALHKLAALRLVRTRQVRGATEHFYTATVRITITQQALH